MSQQTDFVPFVLGATVTAGSHSYTNLATNNGVAVWEDSPAVVAAIDERARLSFSVKRATKNVNHHSGRVRLVQPQIGVDPLTSNNVAIGLNSVDCVASFDKRGTVAERVALVRDFCDALMDAAIFDDLTNVSSKS